MPRRDVAIYHPTAAVIYDRAFQSAGGAERQTFLLARDLARRGLDVAHVVRPVESANFEMPGNATHTVLYRAPWSTGRVGKLAEFRRIWEALAAADARVYVLRMASPALGVAAAFCRTHGRRLVWAAANDGDFTLETFDGVRGTRALFKLGARGADTVVLQSAQQVPLARTAFPFLRHIVQIPSFVEPGPPAAAEPEAFVWAGRLVDYKRPLRYVDLAEAVPEARFRMVAVREAITPQAMIDELTARAESLPNLEVLPAIPHAELQAMLRRAPALVNTSRLEGMPNLFLEAWAMGVPVLTYEFDPDGRVAGEQLGIAAEGSFEAFVAAARGMWRDRGERARYADVTRAYIERVHGGAVGEAWARLIAGDASPLRPSSVEDA